MTVSRLLEEIPSRELTQWAALYQVESAEQAEAAARDRRGA
jgi:hypothetical protein